MKRTGAGGFTHHVLFTTPLPSGATSAILGGMDDALQTDLPPGTKVKVTQQIAARDYAWTSDVTGTVLEFEQKQTGSWYAHSKNDKLWLDRLMLRKDDGEVTTLNLDDYSHVKVLGKSDAVTEKPGTVTGEMTAK